jgi:hypothetical protein
MLLGALRLTAVDEDELTDKARGELRDLENRALHKLWEESFSRLVDYVQRYGDARVPQSYHTDDGYPVGPWVVQQRVDHNSGTLEPDRQRRLQELPGWTWKASSST